MNDSPFCKNCRQALTGFDCIFKDSGAGVMVTKCSRCHFISHHLDRVTLDSFSKHASGLDAVRDALGEIGPLVAGMGIWDMAVAYQTFKKVMDNTLRLQERQKSQLYSPFYASGELEKKAGGEDSGEGEGGPFQHHEQSEGIISNPNPLHYEDAEKGEEIKIAISQIQEFLQKVIPHVVAYAVDHQDGEILKALGELGTTIREARKVWRISREQEGRDYGRSYIAEPPSLS